MAAIMPDRTAFLLAQDGVQVVEHNRPPDLPGASPSVEVCRPPDRDELWVIVPDTAAWALPDEARGLRCTACIPFATDEGEPFLGYVYEAV